MQRTTHHTAAISEDGIGPDVMGAVIEVLRRIEVRVGNQVQRAAPRHGRSQRRISARHGQSQGASAAMSVAATLQPEAGCRAAQPDNPQQVGQAESRRSDCVGKCTAP
jgi:isocitrate/isopropylmalate dehydrogenase